MQIYKISKGSSLRARITGDYVLVRKETAKNIELQKLKGGGVSYHIEPKLGFHRISRDKFYSEVAEGKIVEIKTYTIDEANGIIKIY